MNWITLINAWLWQRGWQIALGTYLVVMGLAGLLVLTIAYQAYTWRAPLQEELWQENRVPSLTIFDEDGATLAIRGAFYGEVLGLDELPVHVAQAFLAIEDRRFYGHNGVDLWGLARAMVVNVRGGGFLQGGSTISQQVAKNLFLSSERTIRRKLHEMGLALWLERHLEKDEILTIYMNRIYLGAGTYGIDAASRFYFGKSARDLSIAEAAMLAGLPKAPSRYAPTTDLTQAQARAELVLANMVREGFITQAQADEAVANPAEPVIFENTDGQQYFVDFVIEEINELIGQTGRNLLVTTTLDREMQAEAETRVGFRLERDGESFAASQAALVTLQPDGAIRAMVGGRNYAESQFNRAVQALRQPGSAFKPFVYLSALEAGYSPATMLVDEPISVGRWEPSNYTDRFIGPVTMADAMRQSINTVAVQLSENVGRQNVIETAQRMGIASPLPALPSIALGAGEVTLLELTNAYVPLQRGGDAVGHYAILEIRAEDGTLLFERQPPEPIPVVEPRFAAQLVDMMYQVVENGTGAAADLGRREAAGKTGTTQDWRDAWFIGFTGDYITGVWVGNDDSSAMARVTGGSMPAQIWRDYMAAVHEGLPLLELERSGEVVPAISTDRNSELRDFLYRTADQFEQSGRRIGGRRR